MILIFISSVISEMNITLPLYYFDIDILIAVYYIMYISIHTYIYMCVLGRSFYHMDMADCIIYMASHSPCPFYVIHEWPVDPE